MLPDPFSDRLAERQADLAPAERRVAEYLAVTGPEAALLSATALAERIGTSDATVVRTAKALGYRGLGELRRALAAVSTNPPLADRLRRTLDHAPADQLLATAVSDHVAALDALTRNVTPEDFHRAVDILAASRRIVWRGIGPSAYLASYGALLAERIGASSRALIHVGTSFADELLTLTPGDAVVVLAYGRPQVDVRVRFLGLMMAFDMGGPLNKVAYSFAAAGVGTAGAASDSPELKIMAAVMLAGMVPPIALALATVLRPRLFTTAEDENGKAGWALGLSFITEGAIPFAAADPFRVIPAIMLGSAVTGGLSMAMDVAVRAPHGGIFVLFAVHNIFGYFIALIAGTVVGAFAVIVLKSIGREDSEPAAERELVAA